MSALPNVTTAKPASAHAQARDAGPGPTDEGVSFEAVLDAQLGAVPTSSSAPPVVLQDDPLGADATPIKAVADDGATAAIDLSAFIPLVTNPQAAVVRSPVAPDSEALKSDAVKSIASSVSALPIKGADPQAKKLAYDPVLAPASDAEQSATAAASLAASVQSLPVASDDLKHAAFKQADSQVPQTPSAINAIATPPREMRLDNLHQPHATTVIPGTVGESRWSDAFSQRVVWMAGQQVRSAAFHVEPPQLGPIEVRLSISNDQANLVFTAPHGVARDAIQASLPRLQEMLAESGIGLGSVSVGSHTPQGQPDPGGHEPRSRSDGDRTFGAIAASALGQAGDSSRAIRHGMGLVDLFA